MKKMVAIILAIAMCVSMLVLPVSAEEQDVPGSENVQNSGTEVLTETGNPDGLGQLPEIDEDLLSIMEDIQALVIKYGPEISDEVKNGTDKGTTCQYKPDAESYYVAIGDDTSADTGNYAELLAEGMNIPYKNLSQNGMLVEDVNADFLANNAAEIEKADLITIGFSMNGFAAIAVEEVLKNMSEEDSFMQWDRYLPEEGVREIEAVLARMEKYLVDNGMSGSMMGVSKSDALVVAAESLAFGTLAFINELPRLVDDIQAINPNAQIVIVGMDNPMDNSSIALTGGEKMELGVYIDQLIANMDNASQTVAIEKSNTVFVSAPDALNENDNKELTENALILSYINGVKSRAIPDAEGQAYIRDKVLEAMGLKSNLAGDIDGDGFVSYNDALMLLRASIGMIELSDSAKALGDVDGKEGISYNDALKILRASIGMDTLE